ncbi:ParA family protein, partial [Klebsiella pneumoniae]|nr:ParA family protein [Klebsiella pneumoniae]
MKSELAEVANDMVDTNKKYLIWNNKGGVGETFLTYNLAV